MDIIEKRRNDKKAIVNRITAGLKKVIQEHGKNFPFNFNHIVMTIESNFSCSNRIAVDYANLALFNVDMTRTDLPFNSRGYDLRLEIPDEVNKWLKDI